IDLRISNKELRLQKFRERPSSLLIPCWIFGDLQTQYKGERMRFKILFVLGIFLLFTYGLEAAVKGEQVDYKASGVTMKGYIAYDDAVKGKRPGILVVPEWWGHNEYADKRARMLAELGYTAFVMDPYGNGKIAATADEAGKLAGDLMKNMDQMVARFQASI